MRKFAFFYTLLIALLFSGCSKNGVDIPADPCNGVVIVINGSAKSTSGPVLTDGSIEANATGGNGFTYSINNGAFQSAGTFSGLASGVYVIIAKSANGCSASASFTVNIGDPCAGKSISLSIVKSATDKCEASGTATVTATGSTGFTYRLNASGAWQNSNVFTGIPAGNHTIYAKDAAGCEKSLPLVIETTPNGTLFSNVVSLINAKCAGCHTNGGSNGGASFSTDCNIVSFRQRIKARAVDAGDMPVGAPLSANDKKVITDWLNAGGKSSN